MSENRKAREFWISNKNKIPTVAVTNPLPKGAKNTEGWIHVREVLPDDELERLREAAAGLKEALLKINTRVEHDRQLYQTDLEAIREYSGKALAKFDAAMKGEE